MLRTKNFGKKSLNEIKEILSEMGLGLGMKLDHLSDGGSEKREE
jgi:DNA-directed RNA polymerase subunit alpha